MNPPTVSVVMSVYNGRKFLREAIESILIQTYKDFEFIIIDDFSSDGTPRIIESYDDPRIVYIRNEKNLGLTTNLNKGLILARGQYIARQDDDDVSASHRLEQQVNFLEQHPDVVLVGCHYYLIDQNGKLFSTCYAPMGDEAIKEFLKEANAFCHGAVIFRNTIVQKVGGYRQEAKYTEDYDLWLRLSEHYKLANIDVPLYSLRRATSSISTENIAKQIYYHLLVRELARERKERGEDSLRELDLSDVACVLIQKYGLSRGYIDGFRSAYLFHYYTQSLQTKKVRDALRYWWMIFQIKPQKWHIRSLLTNVLLGMPVR